jgi:hypothetical protein
MVISQSAVSEVNEKYYHRTMETGYSDVSIMFYATTESTLSLRRNTLQSRPADELISDNDS